MAIRGVWAAVDEAKKQIQNLSVDELKAELGRDPELLLVDIREIQERVDLGTIPTSKHAPRGMLEFSQASNWRRCEFIVVIKKRSIRFPLEAKCTHPVKIVNTQ